MVFKFKDAELTAPLSRVDPARLFDALKSVEFMRRMKPGDHPEFFRFPAPEGRSRESTIVLTENGRFFHDGAPLERPTMVRAFFQWLRRHPDDGRFILSNGYDWTYIHVEDVPFFVQSAKVSPAEIVLSLCDGTEEPLRAEGLRVGSHGGLYCAVKDGDYEARFTPAAQNMLAPALEDGTQGAVRLRIGNQTVELSGGE